MSKPLSGFKIIELVGIGPGPFAGMMFADMGADVIAVDRPGAGPNPLLPKDINRRGKSFVGIDLKSTEGRAAFLDLVEEADAVFEGFRPGVVEKLGIGPADVARINPKAVYGRITGWGQTGPRAHTAGHDINYIALMGGLDAMGPADRTPTPPLNLIGDYGGGAMMLVTGMLAALLEAGKTGRGQTVDAAMVDGASALMSLFWSFKASGVWNGDRTSNFLGGNAHFYGTYATKDAKAVAVGAIEPQFAMAFYQGLGLDPALVAEHMNQARWPELKNLIADRFASETRDHWAQVFDGSDACVTPVLTLDEATRDPHMQARGALVDRDGFIEPAPAPRFSLPDLDS